MHVDMQVQGIRYSRRQDSSFARGMLGHDCRESLVRSPLVGLMLIIHDALGCWCWIYVQQQAMVLSLHLPSLGRLYSLAYITLFGCTLPLRSWAQSLTSPKTQKDLAEDGLYHFPVYQSGKP